MEGMINEKSDYRRILMKSVWKGIMEERLMRKDWGRMGGMGELMGWERMGW